MTNVTYDEPGVLSGERFVSRGELIQRAARVAGGLDCLGVGPGDTVALLLRNDIAFIEASLGAGAIGAYAVPVNWHWHGDEAGYVVRDAGPKALVVHADLLPGIVSALPDEMTVLVVRTPPDLAAAYRVPDDATRVPVGAVDFDEWRESHQPLSRPRRVAPTSMIYTSGTTGRPKGVRRQPLAPNQVAALREVNQRVLGLVRGMRTVIPAPLYHSAPNLYGLAAVRNHGLVVLQPRFDAKELLALIEQHRIDRLQLVPTHFVRLLALPDAVRDRYDISSLRHVVHAAAPCPPDVKRRMIDWWGPIVHEYYGATETGPITACTALEWLQRPGTVGRPLPGAIVRIVDDDGQELGAGEVGEVYVRMPAFGDFTYQGDDHKRREVERDGLLTAGDVGYLDDDGYLFLCDRKYDTVISGGVNIYPAEIEAVLATMPGVRDCAVFGIPDRDYGEALAAAVETEPGISLTADDIRRHVASHLARYKVPKLVDFHDHLPREDSGKIFKRLLRDPYWAGNDRAI